MNVSKLVVALSSAVAALPAVAFANSITSIEYEGSGCTAGSVAMSRSNDGTSATLIFDKFVASVGPSVPEDEDVKYCRITFNLAGSDAFIAVGDTRGYVQLAAGASATSQQHILQAKQGNSVTSFSGPIAKDYLLRADGFVRQRNESSQSFTVNLKVELDGDGSQGQTTIDSYDVKLLAP